MSTKIEFCCVFGWSFAVALVSFRLCPFVRLTKTHQISSVNRQIIIMVYYLLLHTHCEMACSCTSYSYSCRRVEFFKRFSLFLLLRCPEWFASFNSIQHYRISFPVPWRFVPSRSNDDRNSMHWSLYRFIFRWPMHTWANLLFYDNAMEWKNTAFSVCTYFIVVDIRTATAA